MLRQLEPCGQRLEKLLVSSPQVSRSPRGKQYKNVFRFFLQRSKCIVSRKGTSRTRILILREWLDEKGRWIKGKQLTVHPTGRHHANVETLHVKLILEPLLEVLARLVFRLPRQARTFNREEASRDAGNRQERLQPLCFGGQSRGREPLTVARLDPEAEEVKFVCRGPAERQFGLHERGLFGYLAVVVLLDHAPVAVVGDLGKVGDLVVHDGALDQLQGFGSEMLEDRGDLGQAVGCVANVEDLVSVDERRELFVE